MPGYEPDIMPVAGGPFSLSDPDAVTALLEGAGWRDVRVVHHDVEMLVGGGTDPAAAAEDAFGVGPTRKATEGIEGPLRVEVRDAIEAALAERVDADGQVVLGGRVLVVTAHAERGRRPRRWAESAVEGRHRRQHRVGERRMADEQVRKVRVGVVVAQRAAVEA